MVRILVIEDDDQVRNLLKQMLEGEGYEVLDAPDGQVAMKLHPERPADLVITDIIMPQREGLEIIMEFRSKFPDVKIIAISGGGRIEPEEYLHTAKLLGARRTFPKPFEMKEILNAVQELLGSAKNKDRRGNIPARE